MPNTAPHYLLLTETYCNPLRPDEGGRWRFVLEPMNADAEERIEVSEREADVWGERLQILSVVRGLEALDQPSRITLITSSTLVGKQVRRGFTSWIENDWRWERFGQFKPVKDADLWKRIDAAMQIHSIECRLWQFGKRLKTADWDAVEEAKPWTRRHDAHPRFKRNYGPVEFADRNSTLQESGVARATEQYEEPNFIATPTGWTRVTEIDPDRNDNIQFPLAFGETAH